MKTKRIICGLATLIAMSASVYAMDAPIVEVDASSVSGNDTVSPQAEETQWAYRIYEGRLQKRLWSLTRGIWLTDWIDC